MKLYQNTADGCERIKGFYSRGQLLAFEALTDRPVRCGAHALDTCVLRPISVVNLKRALADGAPLWQQLVREFDKEMEHMEATRLLRALPAPQRLAQFLLSMPRDAGDAYLPMSHRDIGNFLNLVPETVSRLFTRLQQFGWLAIHGHHMLLRNAAALQQAAQDDRWP